MLDKVYTSSRTRLLPAFRALALGVVSGMLIGCAAETTARSPGPLHGESLAPFTISSKRLSGLLAEASEFERTLIDDGHLTFAEYERAILAATDCIEEKGFLVIHFPSYAGADGNSELPGAKLTSRGEYRYSVASGPVEGRDPSWRNTFQAEVDACKTAHSSVVSFLWLEHIAPTEREWQEFYSFVGSCIRAEGHDAPDSPSQEELMRLAFPPDGVPDPGQMPADWWTRCWTEAQEIYQMG